MAAPKKAAARKARVPAKLSAKRKAVLRGRPTKLSAPVAARIVKAAILAHRIHSMSAPPKGVGRVYQQTCIDRYAKVAEAELYKTKTPITAADMLNDKVLPFYEQHELPVLRILTDRGTEYCGRADRHDYQLFLAINDIDQTKAKVKSPQTNGICETVPQNHLAGVPPGDIPKEDLRDHRATAE